MGIFRFVAAEDRRRNSTGYVIGLSESRLQKYVLRRLQVIYGPKAYVSSTTLRRLGYPPTIRNKASKRYRKLIAFKRAPMRYSRFKETQNLHFSASQVRTVAEASTMFRDEVLLYSCDNKQKVQVGRPANSAYRRPTGMYMISDQPDLDDHSFPEEKKAQLVPMGYMNVDQFVERKYRMARHDSLSSFPKWLAHSPRRRSFSEPPIFHHQYRSNPGDFKFQSATTRIDQDGRKLINTFRRGHLDVYVTVDRFLTSSSTRHINHLFDIYRGNIKQTLRKKNIHIIADNGPDWKFGPGTVFDFGRLWLSLDLDSLVIVHYAPYCSKLNYIERLWPQLTHATKTVTLPATLPGHVVPPSRMTWLTEEEREEKLREVLMRACESLCTVYGWVLFCA